MAEQYIRAARRLSWLLQELEQALGAASDRCIVDEHFIRTRATRRLPTQDQITAAMAALADLGILDIDGSSLRLSKRSLHDTQEFRSGVWKTLGCAEDTGTTKVQLCAAAPPGLDTAVACRLYEEAIELRAAILEVIVSAERQLILASPFWDEETADEIADLLAKRLEAGVAITVLGRFTEPSNSPTMTILRQLGDHPQCTVLSLFSGGQRGSEVQTFHFKAAVADEGRIAYLGSANLTTSGLRSRLELGVILAGEAARQLYRVINTTLRLARAAF
jgi:phosphatidylserine/phosphatidylglycerophosphate/cardiolipin synthase-like enzyme